MDTSLDTYASFESHQQWERERMGALVLEAQGQPLLTQLEYEQWQEEQNGWFDSIALGTL